MLHTTGKVKVMYKAFGLNVSSELGLPELTVMADSGLTDVTVEFKELSGLWAQLVPPNKYYLAREGFVIFKVPDVAIYLVQNGNEIQISPIPGVEEDALRLHLLGTCMGAILMQRKILPLHGSAIVIDDKAYAIVGDSGAGKSTLANAFLSRGFRLLSDDVIPVTLSSDQVPYIAPAYPQQKLWLESLHEFGLEANAYRPVIQGLTKYAIATPSQFVDKPVPFAGVFELVKTENEEIECIEIPKLERLPILFYHTYRNFFIAPFGLLQWHFTQTAAIVNKIGVHRLRRPTSRFTAHDLASLVIETINNGNEAHA